MAYSGLNSCTLVRGLQIKFVRLSAWFYRGLNLCALVRGLADKYRAPYCMV